MYALIVVFWMGSDVFWDNGTILYDTMAECEKHVPARIVETEHYHPRFQVKAGCVITQKHGTETDISREIPDEQPADNEPADPKQ